MTLQQETKGNIRQTFEGNANSSDFTDSKCPISILKTINTENNKIRIASKLPHLNRDSFSQNLFIKRITFVLIPTEYTKNKTVGQEDLILIDGFGILTLLKEQDDPTLNTVLADVKNLGDPFLEVIIEHIPAVYNTFELIERYIFKLQVMSNNIESYNQEEKFHIIMREAESIEKLRGIDPSIKGTRESIIAQYLPICSRNVTKYIKVGESQNEALIAGLCSEKFSIEMAYQILKAEKQEEITRLSSLGNKKSIQKEIDKFINEDDKEFSKSSNLSTVIISNVKSFINILAIFTNHISSIIIENDILNLINKTRRINYYFDFKKINKNIPINLRYNPSKGWTSFARNLFETSKTLTITKENDTDQEIYTFTNNDANGFKTIYDPIINKNVKGDNNSPFIHELNEKKPVVKFNLNKEIIPINKCLQKVGYNTFKLYVKNNQAGFIVSLENSKEFDAVEEPILAPILIKPTGLNFTLDIDPEVIALHSHKKYDLKCEIYIDEKTHYVKWTFYIENIIAYGVEKITIDNQEETSDE